MKQGGPVLYTELAERVHFISSHHKKAQLILEQHRFELHGFPYMWVFFNEYSTVSVFSLPGDFCNNIFFSLLGCKNTVTEYIWHTKLVLINCSCYQQGFWTAVGYEFGGVRSYIQIVSGMEAQCPNSHVVQGQLWTVIVWCDCSVSWCEVAIILQYICNVFINTSVIYVRCMYIKSTLCPPQTQHNVLCQLYLHEARKE